MLSVSRDQVLAWRMHRQHLTVPGAGSAVELARQLCGIQAQVMSAAAQAIAARQRDPDPGELDRALWVDRTLVRCWSARGTLHLHAADQAAAYGAPLAAARSWTRPSVLRGHGVTLDEITAIIDAIAEVLPGKILTREELTQAVVDHTGWAHLADVLRSGWGFALKPASWLGLLCHGPPHGSRVRFTSPRTWLPGWRTVPVESAGPQLLRCYLGSFGPATLADFTQWLFRNPTASLAKGWLADLGDEVAEIEVDGTRSYALAASLDELTSVPLNDQVRLLPAFDQYVLAVNRDLIPAEHRGKVSRTAGWISPVVLYRGRVAGVWTFQDGTVDMTPFEPVPGDLLATEIKRLYPRS